MFARLATSNGLRANALRTARCGVRKLSTEGFNARAALLAMPNMPNVPGKWIAVAGSVGLAFWLAKNSVLMTDAGVTYVVQNQLTGTLDVYTEPGLHRRVPFFSSVTEYRQVITASFEGQHAISTRFADTYMGSVPVTFRFKLPLHAEGVRKLHREFRSESNLVQSLLMRNAANVTVITATQYTGEEFFQGGLNQFKTQLADQLGNGIYLTERRQVEIEQTDLAPVGAEQEERAPRLVKSKQLVWKTVPLTDDKGLMKRAENPLAQYGIDVTQVLIGDPRPEDNLDRLLMDKKRLVAERIKTVQEQETSKAQARTEQLKKEIQRTKEVQDAQRQKELVVISNQREVEVAKQIAERETIEQRKMQSLAVIQKEKELAVAKAELDIQKANSQAARFEAEAIAVKGKAEADVLAAMYRAKAQNKEIFLAETQRDIAQTLYTNLKGFNVEMPSNVIIGGGAADGSTGRLPSNLDVITGFSALGLMEKATNANKR
mmetsp:Transcript_30394/g.78801  ORF Transcript_30394/g.78801 Transcript_30394/m.78801 type:complete len:490 (-) Transcript_30394:956-2425(-)